ncbi:helix-turn-helix domain-containing protein [Pacificispira sp.]|uniref:helix-turn-helix domain-containing protein n=1 Tax=Pacificispira sp. TaxID=2888761 RepID=UPI003B5266F2
MSSAQPASAGNDMDTGIGQRIRQARETLEWSEEDLAHRLGVTPETVVEWEQSDRDPRSNRIVTLAGVLGVSAHWLLDGSADFAPPANGGDPAVAARAQLESIRLKVHELKLLMDDLEAQLDAL